MEVSVVPERSLALVYWNLSRAGEDFAQTLRQGKLEPVFVKNTHEFEEYLRMHLPEVVILSSEELAEARKFLEVLDLLPPRERREIFTIWVSSKVQTLNPRLAFLLGLHLVVNTEDLPRFLEIYQKGKELWKGFYAPFRQAENIVAKEL
jgi:hypothetical protein